MPASDVVVNPQLRDLGISEIQIRIAVDIGYLMLARIGVPTGAAGQPRSYLTAIGACANHASKIAENVAGADEVVVGDLVKRNANRTRAGWFTDVTPPGWDWSHIDTGDRYLIWRYTEPRNDRGDGFASILSLLGLGAHLR